MPDPHTDSLREFYEAGHAREPLETRLLRHDDFMYGQVLAQLRPHLRPGIKVLDVGCSVGALSLYMASQGCDVLGVDLARNAVAAARANAQRLGVTGARFEASDFVAGGSPVEGFDFVLSSFVLEHIPDDLQFMQRIAAAVRPGGAALVLTAASYTSANAVGKRLPRLFVTDADSGHLRRYTAASLGDLTRQAGLQPERLVYLDSVIREWAILCKPIRRIQRVWGLPGIRRGINALDALLATFLFPGTVAVHARKPGGAGS